VRRNLTGVPSDVNLATARYHPSLMFGTDRLRLRQKPQRGRPRRRTLQPSSAPSPSFANAAPRVCSSSAKGRKESV
jgi:hypothetical protein